MCCCGIQVDHIQRGFRISWNWMILLLYMRKWRSMAMHHRKFMHGSDCTCITTILLNNNGSVVLKYKTPLNVNVNCNNFVILHTCNVIWTHRHVSLSSVCFVIFVIYLLGNNTNQPKTTILSKQIPIQVYIYGQSNKYVWMEIRASLNYSSWSVIYHN